MVLMRISGISFNCFYYAAAALLPMAHIGGGFVAARVIFVSIFTKVAGNKHQGYLQVIGIVISIIGISFVIQPWQPFSDGFSPGFMRVATTSLVSNSTKETYIVGNNSTEMANSSHVNVFDQHHIASVTILGYILVALAGVSDAGNLYLAGEHFKSTSPFVHTLLSGFPCAMVSLILTMYLDDITIHLKWEDVLYISIHTFLTTFLMWSAIASCQLISPSKYAIMGSLSILSDLFIQYVTVHDLHGRRNVLEAIGCCLIFLSTVVTSFSRNTNSSE